MKNLTAHPLLDALIEEKKLKNDAELARVLEVQAPYISKLRNRKAELNDGTRVAIMRKFRWPLKRLDEMYAPSVE